MARREIFICIAFAALVLANEVEDAEQKKRGAGKANVLNSIPTGAQKPEYTYSIYPQNPQPAYQNQASNTFYPNQPSQYYTNSEASQPHQATVPQTSQFVPINFVPNGGYQQKYIVQQKPGNIVTVLQPTPYPAQPILQYPQAMLANPSNHISPHAPIFNSPHGHFNFPQYPLPSFGNPFLGHPSMLVFPQIGQYNNLGLTSPSHGVFYQPQAKPNYSTQPATGGSPNEYEKLNSHQSAAPKEDSDVQTDYIASDSNNVFKNSYNTRNTYTKI
ncbi:uncharacterized protein LOC125051782 [Pieris napi]|uniref:uncharacterized protein LOC125051782 n=1 Tax=Pieris napi TaxID=78633 RepID=UPI001FBA3D74|nr:uncharacterized protein LOC125051782 [Pieris napi]